MRFQIENVTPAKAEKWLNKNVSNRRISDVTVNAYARDIEAGNWAVTPHAIIFNVNGDLLDGQHRLSAIVQSGKTVKMVVVRGCSHDVRKYIDRGRKRSLSDRLKMEGADGRVSLKAAVASLLVKLDRGSTREIVTGDEAVEALLSYEKEFVWLDNTSLSRGYKVAPYVAVVLWSLGGGRRGAPKQEGLQSRGACASAIASRSSMTASRAASAFVPSRRSCR